MEYLAFLLIGLFLVSIWAHFTFVGCAEVKIAEANAHWDLKFKTLIAAMNGEPRSLPVTLLCSAGWEGRVRAVYMSIPPSGRRGHGHRVRELLRTAGRLQRDRASVDSKRKPPLCFPPVQFLDPEHLRPTSSSEQLTSLVIAQPSAIPYLGRCSKL